MADRTSLRESLFLTNEYNATYQNPSAVLNKEQIEFAKKEWGINTDLHRTCINCQIRQMLKYENNLDKAGNRTNKFLVPCSGIAKNLPTGSQELVRRMVEEQEMSRERAQLILQSTIDPVAWAELMFGFNDNNPVWMLRSYQKEQLRCLTGNQKVFMGDGTIKQMLNVQVGDQVLAYNKKKRSYVKKVVLNKISTGLQDVYKVTSYNGDALEVTKNHPFLSYIHAGRENVMFKMKSKMTTYSSLDDGLGSHEDDRVYIATQFSKFGKEDNLDLARFLGYLVTDGYVNFIDYHKIEFANIRKVYIDEYVSLIKKLFPDCYPTTTFVPAHMGKDGSWRQDTWKVTVFDGSTSLVSFLREIGCTDKSNKEMSILNFAFTLSHDALVMFINRCWAGDGCIHNSFNPSKNHPEDSKTSLVLSSGNREYLELFRLLLRKIGIFRSYIYKQHKEESNQAIGLNIQAAEQVETFFKEIGLVFGKEESSQIAIDGVRERKHMKGQFKSAGRFSIKSVEYIGQKETYDIEVEDFHNFIAEGFIVHNCSSRRSVIREGRRAGKALDITTEIPSPDGWTTMEKLEVGDRVFDENGRPCNVTYITEIMNNHDCYRVEFNDGSHIIADAEHQWSVQTKSMRKSNARNATKKHGLITLTTEQMLKNVKVGLKNESNYSIPLTKPLQYVSEDIPLQLEPYLLGFWLGDGVRNTSRVTIGLEDQEESIRNIENLGYKIRRGGFSDIDCCVYGLISKLKKLGISNAKRIPPEYLKASVNQRLELLKGLMDTDGSALENGTCEFTSSEPALAEDVYELIIGLGFKASKRVGESWFDGNQYKDRTRIYFNPSTNVFRLTCKSDRIKQKSFSQNNRYITAIVPVESVPVKCIMVDSESHLYLAGRQCIPTHNTFIVALKLLFFVFNRLVETVVDEQGTAGTTGPTILIVTPYQSQLLTVFDQMEQILKKNKGLCAEVASASGDSLYVKTPFFHMDFRNGAVIKGFVSGVGIKSDGSGGGTMRGSSAQVIYLDEMDMIPEETIDKVIMPILLSDLKGDTCFIATSTPIGKRAKFYKFCLQDPTFKEDYLPSSVIPQWETQKELLIGDSTPESIQTEFMAAFIDGDFGVFKPSYVYRARRDYSYEDCNSSAWWKKSFAVLDSTSVIRCIGIDWNKNAGTEFVVATYIPHMHRYIITETVNIGSGEFSALRWREELIRLNYKWKPDYIYADEGYGHTIIEDLKLIAFNLGSKPNKNLQDVETTKLVDRLKSFNFSSKVSLRNPLDGTEIEKAGKDFLVETARSIFEDPGKNGGGIMWFPESEDQLKNELLHYTVLRRSPTTNKAVYGTDSERIGDHRLDAMMLALGGIQLEAGLYSNRAIANSVPTFLDKERLEKRETPETTAGAFVRFLEKQTSVAPAQVGVLNIAREGETPEQAASRGHRGQRIMRRDGGEPEGNTVFDHFKKLQSTAGYDTDRETSAPKVLDGRRHNRDRTIKRRG